MAMMVRFNDRHGDPERPDVLFAPSEAEPQGEGPALAAGEASKARRFNAVYHSVRILAAKHVHSLHARSPEIPVECEFLL